MSTSSIAKSRNLKTAASKKRSVKSSATARRKVTSAATAAKVPPKSDEPKVERVTKQERLLTLLSQAEGASIEEMMQATDWQQHSVRGFLRQGPDRRCLQGRSPDAFACRFRQDRRRPRRAQRILRVGNAAVQYDDLHGTPDAQHAALLRPIRARDRRRAYP